MAIFRFFKMPAAAILDFENVEISGVGRPKCVTMPNFAAIGPTKGTSLGRKTSHDVYRQNRSTGATCARDEETKKRKKDKDRNPTVANWLFAETTHVVASK